MKENHQLPVKKSCKRKTISPIALAIKKHFNPLLTLHENFKRLEKKGKLSHVKVGYDVLKRHGWLDEDLQQIQRRTREIFDRMAIPLALSNIVRGLVNSDKDYTKQVLHFWAKQDQPQQSPVQIQILNQIGCSAGGEFAGKVEEMVQESGVSEYSGPRSGGKVNDKGRG